MKKFLSLVAILLVMLVALTLASCENTNAGEETSDTTTTKPTETRDVNKDDDEDEDEDDGKTEEATSTEEVSSDEPSVPDTSENTTVTSEETTVETSEESTTEEETVNSPIIINPNNTKRYEDDYVAFDYPGESDWEIMAGEYFGGSITYLEYVSVDISASEAMGMYGITKAEYKRDYVSVYEELLGMKISGLSVSDKTNSRGVSMTVIEQVVTIDMDGESVSMEMDMIVVPVDTLEITVTITKYAPADALNTMIIDSLSVVYEGASSDDNSGGNSGGYDDYSWAEENLFLSGAQGFSVEPQKLAPGASVATKFTVNDNAKFSGVYIECPSWNDNNGTLKISIYRWVDGAGDTEQARLKSGYQNTVSEDNLVLQGTFVNYNDNAFLGLYLDDVDVEAGGTYLVVLSNPDATDYGVGYHKSSYDARAYYNGQIKYQLPTDIASYRPRYTSNVVAFNTKGVPSTSGYMNLGVEVII